MDVAGVGRVAYVLIVLIGPAALLLGLVVMPLVKGRRRRFVARSDLEMVEDAAESWEKGETADAEVAIYRFGERTRSVEDEISRYAPVALASVCSRLLMEEEDRAVAEESQILRSRAAGHMRDFRRALEQRDAYLLHATLLALIDMASSTAERTCGPDTVGAAQEAWPTEDELLSAFSECASALESAEPSAAYENLSPSSRSQRALPGLRPEVALARLYVLRAVSAISQPTRICVDPLLSEGNRRRAAGHIRHLVMALRRGDAKRTFEALVDLRLGSGGIGS